MITAERAGDTIVLESTFRDKELVKLIPGSRWNNNERIWSVPLSWASCKILRGLFGADLTVGPELAVWSRAELDHRILPAMRLRDSHDAVGSEELRPYQRVGVAFLRTCRDALLADDMGTGKTVQALQALRELNAVARMIEMGEYPQEAAKHDPYPALVVCPNSVKIGWHEHTAIWTPEVKAEVVTGNVKKRREVLERVRDGETQIVVMNWEGLRAHSRLAPYGNVRLRKCEICDPVGSEGKRQTSCEVCPRELNEIAFRTVVADEAHRAKDPAAKQTRALWAIADQETVNYRWALTGTPIGDAIDDLWSVMRFVAKHEYPAKTKFIDRYAMMSWNAFGGMDIVGVRPETRDEFFSILDPRMLRRPKALVMPYLPEKVYVERVVEMGTKQKKIYEQLRDEMIAELDSGETVLATNALTSTTRLVQAAAACLDSTPCAPCAETGVVQPPRAGTEVREDAPPPGSKCKKCTGRGYVLVPVDPSCKIDELVDLVEELGDEQIVVFAVSRKLIELAAVRLEKKRIRCTQITGAIPAAMRNTHLKLFQNGQAQICLATIGAAGTGFDGLQTAASTVVFLQRDYSRLNNQQAEDRLHRMGQTKSVVVIDIKTIDTVESNKDVILALKEGRFEELVRDAETLRRMLGG